MALTILRGDGSVLPREITMGHVARGLAILLQLLISAAEPAAAGVSAPAPAAPLTAAYPIPPQTVRTLFAEASLVVLAKVTAVEFVSLDEHTLGFGGHGELATLSVERVFKGEVPESLRVFCNWSVICPPDARYRLDSEVIAFLRPAEHFAHHRTVRCSWGVRCVGDDTREAWIATLDGLVALSKVKPEERRALEIEWIVVASEQAGPRWDGAYELARVSSPDPYFDDDLDNAGDDDFDDTDDTDDEESPRDRAQRVQPAWRELTAEQRARLKLALLAATDFGPGERCLMGCFHEDGDPALARWLFDRLEALAKAPRSKKARRELTPLLSHYLERAALAEAATIATEFTAAYDSREPHATRVRELRAVLNRLRPPPP